MQFIGKEYSRIAGADRRIRHSKLGQANWVAGKASRK
jgi:hypothetical protein